MKTTLDRILASLMFFTRLPWWRLRSVPSDAFTHVVDWWPLVGWITAGVTAGVLIASVQVLPVSVSVLLAIVARILVTGALHEDGFADFFDGMGGGTTRQRILQIMKDSHIGTYGVLSLVLYLLLYYYILRELSMGCLTLSISQSASNPFVMLAGIIFSADVMGKSAASFIVQQLPYARTEQTAKNGVVYQRLTGMQRVMHLLRILVALVPGTALMWCSQLNPHVLWYLLPLVAQALLVFYLRRRIQGYTGDCCGAAFIFCELAFYLAVTATFSL